MNDYLKLLLDWVPILAILGVVAFWTRKLNSAKSPIGRYREDYLGEMRKQTEQLGRIAAALEQRGRE